MNFRRTGNVNANIHNAMTLPLNPIIHVYNGCTCISIYVGILYILMYSLFISYRVSLRRKPGKIMLLVSDDSHTHINTFFADARHQHCQFLRPKTFISWSIFTLLQHWTTTDNKIILYMTIVFMDLFYTYYSYPDQRI